MVRLARFVFACDLPLPIPTCDGVGRSSWISQSFKVRSVSAIISIGLSSTGVNLCALLPPRAPAKILDIVFVVDAGLEGLRSSVLHDGISNCDSVVEVVSAVTVAAGNGASSAKGPC